MRHGRPAGFFLGLGAPTGVLVCKHQRAWSPQRGGSVSAGVRGLEEPARPLPGLCLSAHGQACGERIGRSTCAAAPSPSETQRPPCRLCAPGVPGVRLAREARGLRAHLQLGGWPLRGPHVQLAHLRRNLAHQLRVVPARQQGGAVRSGRRAPRQHARLTGWACARRGRHAPQMQTEAAQEAAHQYFSMASAPEAWMSSNTCFNSGSSLSSSSLAFCSGPAVADSRCTGGQEPQLQCSMEARRSWPARARRLAHGSAGGACAGAAGAPARPASAAPCRACA